MFDARPRTMSRALRYGGSSCVVEPTLTTRMFAAWTVRVDNPRRFRSRTAGRKRSGPSPGGRRRGACGRGCGGSVDSQWALGRWGRRDARSTDRDEAHKVAGVGDGAQRREAAGIASPT
jgi:hypothetical protein